MSSLDVHAVVARMGGVVGARLANFYELEGGLYAARFKGAGGLEYLLVIEPGVRAHGSRRVRPPGGVPRSRLALLARKHLKGRRLEGVEQLGFDRVMVLSFSGDYRLYVELVPRGFAVLVGPDGVILAADRYAEMRDRVVRPGVEYRPPPPSRSPLPRVDAGVVAEAVRGRGHLVRALVRGLGLPGEAAEEAAHRAGLPFDADPDGLGEAEIEALARAVEGIIREAREGRGFRVEDGSGASLEAVPFRPTRFEGRGGYRVVEYDSIDDALDDHFHLLAAGRGPGGAAEAERARLLRALEEARRRAAEYEERARALEEAAQALAARYAEASTALECAWREWRARRAESCPGVAGADYSRGTVALDLGGVRVEARVGETVDRLIVRLYGEAGELRAKARRALESVRGVEERLRELERRARLEEYAALARSRRRYWFERYHWIVTRSGFLAVGGRDADQNEAVVKRYLGEEDIFMHADIHGAPAVVVLARGRRPPDEDLMDAAVVAAAYSRAWREGLGSVRVYWAWGRQVSKSPPAGEYLAKGAFMVYGRKNYLPPVPVRLALGIAVDQSQGAPIVIVGPEDLVAERSLAYALLAPGDESPQELAQRLRRLLASRLPEPDSLLVEAVPVEDVRLRIPGRSRVLRVARGRGAGFNPPPA